MYKFQVLKYFVYCEFLEFGKTQPDVLGLILRITNRCLSYREQVVTMNAGLVQFHYIL